MTVDFYVVPFNSSDVQNWYQHEIHTYGTSAYIIIIYACYSIAIHYRLLKLKSRGSLHILDHLKHTTKLS